MQLTLVAVAIAVVVAVVDSYHYSRFQQLESFIPWFIGPVLLLVYGHSNNEPNEWRLPYH